jgi:F-type H+-transporting ATPase subunit b
MSLGVLLLAASAVHAASDANGAGGAAHAPGLWLLGVQVLNVAILLFILVRFAGPALRDYFQGRSQQIRESIEGAQAQLREAEAEIAELRGRLEAFEAESGRLVEAAAEAAEGERARMLERARATAQRLREDAERVADSEIARARQVLRAEAARLATELAGQLLRAEATREDDTRMVGEFVDKLGGSA